MAHVFYDLVERNQVGIVTKFFEHCMLESFRTDNPQMRHRTDAEVKRRFDVIASTFKRLRGDEKWSLEKIFELMPQYVRSELDGDPWTPQKEEFWVPTGA